MEQMKSVEEARKLVLDELAHTMPDEAERIMRTNNILQAAIDPDFSVDDVYEMLTPQQGGHAGIEDQMARYQSAHIIYSICSNRDVQRDITFRDEATKG